jgi:hypothetical protein
VDRSRSGGRGLTTATLGLIEYESKEVYPLMLDPFGLVGGELHWAGSEDYAAGDDDDGERDFVQIS